jgi:hypothetical protein
MSGVFLTGCNSSQDPAPVALTPQQEIAQSVDSLKAHCMEGDLVVHLNDDIVSDVIRNMNDSDKSYSHSGIIVIRNGKKMVCNIYPSLHPNTYTDTIQYEPLDSFLNPRMNLTAGLFRYDLNDTEKKAFLAAIDSTKAANPHFDEMYNYSTDSLLYCSEMIAKALVKATNGRYHFKQILLSETMVKVFKLYYQRKKYSDKLVRSTAYISIDNLYNIPQCKEIARVKLKYMP